MQTKPEYLKEESHAANCLVGDDDVGSRKLCRCRGTATGPDRRGGGEPPHCTGRATTARIRRDGPGRKPGGGRPGGGGGVVATSRPGGADPGEPWHLRMQSRVARSAGRAATARTRAVAGHAGREPDHGRRDEYHPHRPSAANP